MRTKSLKKNKINVITLGCSKNLVDSENLITQLKASNFEVTHDNDQPESQVVVVNTCGFIDNAKEESVNTIINCVEAKKKGLIKKVYVTGCLSERYKPDLKKEIPEVDEYFGTTDLPILLKALGADYKHELLGERLTTTPKHYAYLKIAEGCDRPCAFCAIPLMRGKHKSRTIESLVTEAQNLAKQGTKELILIAQDLTYYGLDIYKRRVLAKLLTELEKVEGIEWIRLHYAYPTGFPLDVLEVMQNADKICKYIDIPLQHISSNVLKNMRRGTTKEKTYGLLKAFKEKVPGIAIRTTLLVGFPGETEKDFNELKEFIQTAQLDRVGIFTYSHEENTRAHHSFNDDIPEKVKQKRAKELMDIQEIVSLKKNENKIGGTFKVLIDRKEGGFWVGRTEFDSPDVDNEVLIDAHSTYISKGSFVNIKITGAEAFDLYGVLIS